MGKSQSKNQNQAEQIQQQSMPIQQQQQQIILNPQQQIPQQMQQTFDPQQFSNQIPDQQVNQIKNEFQQLKQANKRGGRQNMSRANTLKNANENKGYNDDDEIQLQKEFAKNKKGKTYDLQKGLSFNLTPLHKAIKLDKSKTQTLPCMVSVVTQDNMQPEEEQKQDENANRPGVDLICVIDTSGSMRGNKIQLVIDTLMYLLELLNEKDRLCLIGYQSNSYRICPLKRVTKQNLKELEENIKSLQAGGGTNTESGMVTAFEVLKQRRFKNSVSSIFLLSDGVDTNSKCAEVIEKQLAIYNFEDNFTISSFGFGESHDSKLLTSIAELRDGSFYYIENLEQVDECFVDALGGLFSVVAEDIQIEVKANTQNLFSEMKISKVYGDMWHPINDTEKKITLKQLISGVSKEYILELEIPKIDKQISDFERNANLLTAKISAKSLENKEIVTLEAEMVITLFNQNEEIPKDSEYDENVQLNFLRVRGAEALKNCIVEGDKGNYEKGQLLIDQVVAEIGNARQNNQIKLQSLNVDLQNAKNSCKPTEYARGKHQMMQQQRCHFEKQSRGIDNLYSNQCQMNMQSKAKSRKGNF